MGNTASLELLPREFGAMSRRCPMLVVALPLPLCGACGSDVESRGAAGAWPGCSAGGLRLGALPPAARPEPPAEPVGVTGAPRPPAGERWLPAALPGGETGAPFALADCGEPPGESSCGAEAPGTECCSMDGTATGSRGKLNVCVGGGAAAGTSPLEPLGCTGGPASVRTSSSSAVGSRRCACVRSSSTFLCRDATSASKLVFRSASARTWASSSWTRLWLAVLAACNCSSNSWIRAASAPLETLVCVAESSWAARLLICASSCSFSSFILLDASNWAVISPIRASSCDFSAWWRAWLPLYISTFPWRSLTCAPSWAFSAWNDAVPSTAASCFA
mmetsp:Transcript_25694/g.76665  ORF Transcript_25694/g.76665 Transcript_25694/m.76665 type:complete len:334 (-) Transcript_25694:1983-2984(-)